MHLWNRLAREEVLGSDCSPADVYFPYRAFPRVCALAEALRPFPHLCCPRSGPTATGTSPVLCTSSWKYTATR